MKPYLVRALIAVAAIALIPSMSFATVLSFDDLPPVLASTIPNGYGGLNWSDMGYLDSSGSENGYVGGTASGDYVAFNRFERVATVSDTLFNFNSATMAAAWNRGLSVTVKGFKGGMEKYSVTLNNLAYSQTKGASAQLANFNFTGIDTLTFTSFGGVDADPNDGGDGTHFAMDNFDFDTDVPEPTTLALLGLGLGTLFYRRKS